MMTSGQVAKQFDITVRTLQHYDDIGLLCPARTGEGKANNRKLYSEGDIERLKQILTYRKLGFRLDEIAGILASTAAEVEEILNARIRDLWVQKDHIHSLAATVTLSKVLGLDRFMKRAWEMGDLDEYYRNRMPSHAFLEAMRRIEDLTEEDIRLSRKSFTPIVANFTSFGEELSYPQMETACEALWEWYEERWFQLPEGGFFILWGLFAHDNPLAQDADMLGGAGTAALIRTCLHTLWMQDAMLELYPVLNDFEDHPIDRTALADDYDEQHLHLRLIEALCCCTGMDNPFVSVPDDWECDDFVDIGDYTLAMVCHMVNDAPMMRFLGLEGLIEVSEFATTQAREALLLLFKETAASE